MENSSKERVQWIDIAKMLGIVIVLTFHALPGGYAKFFLSQFHMPLFAFLSGYVLSPGKLKNCETFKSFVWGKIRSIYCPFVLYNTLFLFLHNFLFNINFIGHVNGNYPYTISDAARKFVSILTIGGGESLPGPLWYLIADLEFTIIFAIVVMLVKAIYKKINVSLGYTFRETLIVILLCFVLSLLFYLDLPRNLGNAFRLMLFYCIGYYFKQYNIENYLRLGWKSRAFFCVSVICLIACTFVSHSWQGQNFIVAYISASAGIYIVIVISKVLDLSVIGTLRKAVLYIGRHTLPILVFHLFCNCFVKLAYVCIYQLDYSLVATTESIPNYYWTPIYVMVGLAGSLCIDSCFKYARNCVFRFINLFRRTQT